MKLTKPTLDTLTCPPGRKDRLIFDDSLPGFGVRVTATGGKTFILQYRRDGRLRRLALGRYGDLTLAEARRLAEAARGRIAQGGDPVTEAQAERAERSEAQQRAAVAAAEDAFTLDRLMQAWATERLTLRSRTYAREAVRMLRTVFVGLMGVPVARIDAPAIRAALSMRRGAGGTAPRRKGPAPDMAPPGNTTLRRARAYLHAMFAWGMQQGLVTENPAASVHVDGRYKPRERFLTDVEIGEVWRAAGRMAWPWGAYFRMLTLTLQRGAEVAGMRWFELSADATRWELPGARTKNGKPHIVHLARPAQRIAATLPRVNTRGDGSPSPFLFTVTGAAPISGSGHAKARLDGAIMTERIARAAATGQAPAPLIPWRLHDLRRTGVTVMARLGIRWEVADRILNHVGGAVTGVAAVYQRHEWLDERATALDRWAAHVLAVAGENEAIEEGSS